MNSRANVFAVFLLLILVAGPVLVSAQDRVDALELYRQGRYQAAVDATMKEIESMPRNMNSYTVLGWSLLALDRYQEALEYGMRALQISRYDSRVIQIVGEAHFRLGHNLEALKYLQEYIAINPNGELADQVYDFMGETLIRLGEFHRADIALSTAVYMDPENARWWSRLGFAREQVGDNEYALEAYNKALELDPRLTEALRGRARIRERTAG